MSDSMQRAPAASVGERLLQIICPDSMPVVEFFAVMSRFEYALKRCGFVRHLSNDAGEAMGVGVTWRKLARQLKEEFATADHSPEVRTAIAYLVKHPPSRQLLRGESLVWENAQPVDAQSLESLLGAVYTVRNNLFHGGKYPHGPIADPARNEALLIRCLLIVDAVVNLNQPQAKKLAGFFWETE